MYIHTKPDYTFGNEKQGSCRDSILRDTSYRFFNVNNYMYDTAGNMIESIDKNGNFTRYTYNSRSVVTNIASVSFVFLSIFHFPFFRFFGMKKAANFLTAIFVSIFICRYNALCIV